jgi:hypothetical protein
LIEPGAGAQIGFAIMRKNFQGTDIGDSGNALQCGEHGHFKTQVVTQAGHFDQILENGLFHDGKKWLQGRTEG